MGTRCAIIVKIGPKLYHGVHVQFDGYLSGVGQTLIDHYNADDLARGLVSLGDLSSVAGSKWSGVISESVEPQREHILELLASHSYDNHHEDLVIAYHRDRGDPLEDGPISTGTLLAVSLKLNYAYTYVWDGEKWMFGSQSLADALAEDEED